MAWLCKDCGAELKLYQAGSVDWQIDYAGSPGWIDGGTGLDAQHEPCAGLDGNGGRAVWVDQSARIAEAVAGEKRDAARQAQHEERIGHFEATLRARWNSCHAQRDIATSYELKSRYVARIDELERLALRLDIALEAPRG